MPASRNTQAPTGESAQDRLPTRVNNACRRCRRNKSRCDRFRPCSLCLRADVECEPADLSQPASGRSRAAKSRNGPYPSRRDALPHGNSSVGRSTHSPLERTPSSVNRESSFSGEMQSPQISIPVAVRHDFVSTPATANYRESESAMSIVRRICRLGSQSIDGHPTSAIPDGELETHLPQMLNGNRRVPIKSILAYQFPGEEIIHTLLEDYFETVHWFSLVIYEPHFRKRLATVADGYAYPSDTPFLLLLSVVLCMAAWYRSARGSGDDAETWRLLSNELLQIVESRLIHIMDHHSLTAIQTCILLGSHHVYHGRPNLSFSLLGATIKMAHALSLHRHTDHGNPDDIEERKRAWWTIYTWDRFASISYGRPLSIDDDDCNVPMPDSYAESPNFRQRSPTESQISSSLYSPYQAQLSKLYVLASPALKMIFGTGSTRPSKQDFELRYGFLINDVTKKLLAWHDQLPPYLSLDLSQDYQPGRSTHESRAHTLQSLALQLTFDNLLIVLYRPFLSQQVERLSAMTPGVQPDTISASPCVSQTQAQSQHSTNNDLRNSDLESPGDVSKGVSEHWWSAAVRTAQVTDLPQLAQLATDTHLVAFMAMNLFHSAIVLVLNALSNPLSDRSQGVKRTITRVLRLQELLGQQSALSSQSSAVLKNLIRLLLRREGEAMLGLSLSTPQPHDNYAQQLAYDSRDKTISTVEDALRLPIGESQTARQYTDSITMPVASDAQRLGENLASVRRVFPTSNDHGPQYDTWKRMYEPSAMHDGTAHPTQPQGNSWASTFENPNSTNTPQEMNYDGTSADMGGNNMFWLWDYSWDGLFDGVGNLAPQ